MAKSSDITLKDIFSYITANQYVYLSTTLDSQPKIRPMSLFYYKGNFYFVTYTNDAKVAQIKNNKLIEVILPIKDELNNQGYIKLTGKAKICTDADAKYDATYFCYFFDEMYDGPDDPDFCLIECTFDVYEYFEPGKRHSIKVYS
jgi:general stress protein 26